MKNNSNNSFWELIENKEKLRKEFIKITFFISLYENFKKNWEDTILSFYANDISFDENKNFIYGFTKPNDKNPRAFEQGDFIKDKDAEDTYKKEVYRTQKKENGDLDREASLFNWLLTRGLIEHKHFESLLQIRLLRNKLVHELDKMLFKGMPDDLSAKLRDLIEIRKYSSRQWIIQVELPINGETKVDEDGNVIEPQDAYSSSDLIYDIIYGTVID